MGPKLANDITLCNNNDHGHREYVKGINNRFELRPTDSGQVLKLLNKLVMVDTTTAPALYIVGQ